MTVFFAPVVGQQGSAGGGLQLLLLPLLVILMIFLMTRSQRKRQKALQELQSEIQVGDEVMTSSGIYGFISGEEADLYWLQIDEDVQIRISKAAIHSRVPEATDTVETSKADADSRGLKSGASDESAEQNDADDTEEQS